MPNRQKQTWTDYAKRLAAKQLGLATAYALSSQNPKAKTQSAKPKPKPKQKKKSAAYNAGAGLMRSKQRYEQAARMSRGQ